MRRRIHNGSMANIRKFAILEHAIIVLIRSAHIPSGTIAPHVTTHKRRIHICCDSSAQTGTKTNQHKMPNALHIKCFGYSIGHFKLLLLSKIANVLYQNHFFFQPFIFKVPHTIAFTLLFHS